MRQHRDPIRRVTALALALTVLSTAVAAPPPAPPPPAQERPETVSRPDPNATDPRPSDPDASPLLDRHYRTPRGPAWPSPNADPLPEAQAQRFQILAAAGVRPGMRVADFAVGRGLITALFARAVGPEGRVYGVGSTPDLPLILSAIAREYRVENLVPVASTGTDAALPRAGIELAFVTSDLRPFSDPPALFADIHRALIPYGTLIIVAPRAPAGLRVDAGSIPNREVLLALARQAGFRLVEESFFLHGLTLLRLERGGDETAAEPEAVDPPADPDPARPPGPAPRPTAAPGARH